MVKGSGVLLWCWLGDYAFNIRLGNATNWTRPRMRDSLTRACRRLIHQQVGQGCRRTQIRKQCTYVFPF